MDTEEYRAGYRNGRLDRIIRAEPLVIALTHPGSYGQGYFDGYNSLPLAQIHYEPRLLCLLSGLCQE